MVATAWDPYGFHVIDPFRCCQIQHGPFPRQHRGATSVEDVSMGRKKEERKLSLPFDNCRIHRSKRSQEFLKEIRSSRYPRLQVHRISHPVTFACLACSNKSSRDRRYSTCENRWRQPMTLWRPFRSETWSTFLILGLKQMVRRHILPTSRLL
jgi:hypothetical protein